MFLDFIDQKIRNAFSQAADDYDLLTSLHQEIGRELYKKVIKEKNAEVILDIGMGTGWMTHWIKFFLPASNVVGIDFADGMIKQANEKYDDFKIVQANALHMPFKNNTFDIVTSNCAFQWIADHQRGFDQIHSLLKNQGKVSMTMFGYETFHELFEAIHRTKGDNAFTINRLAKREEIVKALEQADFKNINVDYEHIKVRFNDMVDLVKWIKSIGANCLGARGFIGKEALEKANEYYNEQYKDRLGVYSTLEIIWIEAQK